MLLSTRSEAKAAGQNKYYTGELCSNKHLTFRYTQSGACAGCVRKEKEGYTTPSGPVDRKKFMQESTEIYIFVPFTDVDMMRQAVQQLNDQRWPGMTTVLMPLKDRDATQGKFKVRAHFQDSQVILKLAAMLCKRLAPDLSHFHKQVATAVTPVFAPIEPRA